MEYCTVPSLSSLWLNKRKNRKISPNILVVNNKKDNDDDTYFQLL